MENSIEFKQIGKQFSGVRVLKDISFCVAKGEVHALLGENGAGKSTLLNILHGVYQEYEGEIWLGGNQISFKNPNEAIRKGHIVKVHQEVNVVRDLTVGQNITLGYEPRRGIMVDYRTLNQSVNQILDRLKCSFRAEDMASRLTAGEMQMLAIAKALFHNAQVISLDEPTASLTTGETASLFKIIRELKESGITIIYVSHRLEEIFQICDRATILRDGVYITTLEVGKITRETLIRHMVGRDVNAVASRMRESCVQDEVVLRVEGLGRKGVFEDISFELKKGEILGFAGLVGAGRTEVMRAIFGADAKHTGTICLKGKEVNIRNTQDALRLGIGLLPEERKTQGFVNMMTNIDNTALSSIEKYLTNRFVDDRKKRKNYLKYENELNINPKKPDYLTQNMSGGNQQKIILARWMSTNVDILIFDEPTKGVDVAAKAEIYRLMEDIVHSGKSIIVVSSELPEVMGISDRMVIMCEGKKTGELQKEEFAEQVILNYAMGGKDNGERK